MSTRAPVSAGFDLGPDPDPVVARRPVGPVVEVADGAWGRGTATFSGDRRFRFRLSRVWDPTGPRVNFVLLNPSTADASVLDPTVRRCAGFARAWGAGAFEVTNAYALRSTDPRGLTAVDDPVGAGNDEAVVAAARAADRVVVAWGVHATHLGRGDQVAALLAGAGQAGAGLSVTALAVTRDGHPGHPLYLPATAEPVRWPPAR